MIKKEKEILQNKIKNLFVSNSLPFPYTWSWKEDTKGLFYNESNGKKRYGIIKTCQNCERNFLARNDWVRKSIVCSKFCSNMLREDRIQFDCSWCNKNCCSPKSRLKKSKHGLHFCSTICKNKAQKIDGIKTMHPSHYKDANTTYAKRAFEEYGSKCVDCNINMKNFLEVHHKDGNRNNSDIKNLEIVCIIHHMLRHMVFRRGNWVLDYQYLTPLDDLEKLKKELIKV